MNIFENISWKTREWNYKFELLSLRLHDQQEVWGVKLFTISKDFEEYSLFNIEFRLPNKTTVNTKLPFVDHFDLFFLHNPLYKRYVKLDDYDMWGRGKLNLWEKLQLKILKLLF